jgi:Xaa-Pro aminopeptidase
MLFGVARIRQLLILQLAPRQITPSFTLRSRFSTSMGAVGTQTVNTTVRLAALRELMSKKENNVDVFVVPSEDQREHSPH